MQTIEMKGITCCGDCVYYNWENDRCKKGASIEENGYGYFYKDCPLSEVVTVRHGKWIRVNDEFSQCNLCKYPVHASWCESKYCPNCGCKMDGV